MSRFCNIAILLLALFPTTSFAATAGVEDVKSIARLYSAAFDREPDISGLNFWVSSYEAGRSLESIAGDFYKSPEFTANYGSLSDQQYVERLYQNVLGRAGETGGLNFWTGHLSNGVSRGSILAEFADSPENIAKTDPTFSSMRYEGGNWVFGGVAVPPPSYCGTYSAPQIYPSYASPFYCGAPDEVITTIMGGVNAFWGSNMYACACGRDQPQCRSNAIVHLGTPYDSRFGYIYYDRDLLTSITRTSGTPLATAWVLAHEAGHVLQVAYSKRYPVPVFQELSADCLSGYFLGKLDCEEVGSISDYLSTLLIVCDAGGTSAFFDPIGHGSCRERVYAVLFGMDSYQKGIRPFDACM